MGWQILQTGTKKKMAEDFLNLTRSILWKPKTNIIHKSKRLNAFNNSSWKKCNESYYRKMEKRIQDSPLNTILYCRQSEITPFSFQFSPIKLPLTLQLMQNTDKCKNVTEFFQMGLLVPLDHHLLFYLSNISLQPSIS